jgi:hypothetical protein
MNNNRIKFFCITGKEQELETAKLKKKEEVADPSRADEYPDPGPRRSRLGATSCGSEQRIRNFYQH